MDWFVSGNDGSTFELAIHVPVTASDPFLRIKKKMGPLLNLEVGKQAAGLLMIVEVDALG